MLWLKIIQLSKLLCKLFSKLINNKTYNFFRLPLTVPLDNLFATINKLNEMMRHTSVTNNVFSSQVLSFQSNKFVGGLFIWIWNVWPTLNSRSFLPFNICCCNLNCSSSKYDGRLQFGDDIFDPVFNGFSYKLIFDE